MISTPTDVPPPGQVPGQQRSQDVLLRSGGMAQLRRVTTDDEMSLRALNARVSSRTRMLRYFSPSEQPGDWYVDHVLRSARTDDALVALVGGHVVALGSFFRLQSDPTVGDLALLVEAVAGVLLCLANLARDLPEVCELDINPLVVTPTGVLGLDTRVRVCPVSASALPESSLVRPRH